MENGAASRTAVLVGQGRAVAHGRMAVGRFDDPTAMALLRDAERAAVEQVRAGVAPRPVGARIAYEMLRASAEVMVARTISIDDAIREHPTPQLVILGAGLDGRAWRMPELATVDVFEVDHPGSQHDKRDRVGTMPATARSLRFVPVDFTRDDLATALAAAGHQPAVPTTWVWEGVVPYLTRAEVEATVGTVTATSPPGSRLIVNYQAPNLAATAGRLAARAMTVVTRQTDPMAHEPRRSAWTPAAMARLLASQGWTVARDDDLLTLSDRLSVTVENRRSLRSGRVAVADR